MKRVIALVMISLILFGCASDHSYMDRALSLRERILKSETCTFDACVTADYGEMIYTFDMQCHSEHSGAINFVVTKPDSISGISGTISAESGQIAFDDKVLAFSTIAEGQITPVSTPWVFFNSLKNGYLRACSKEKDGYLLCIDDSYKEDALRLDVWIDETDQPIAADILWQGKRIMSIRVSNFTIV